MSEKELAAKMDAALSHVDPDRRKFLGILLAGVAAAPLLRSASLAAEDKAHFPKTQTQSQSHMKSQSNMKAQTWTKGGSTVNDDKRSNIKAQDAKGGQSKGANSDLYTLAGFHALNTSMFKLSKAYVDRGMAGFSELQQQKFALEKDGFKAIRRQALAVRLFDAVQM